MTFEYMKMSYFLLEVSNRDKVNLKYISRSKPHFISKFHEIELDLHFTS